jgi:hypothetical protein
MDKCGQALAAELAPKTRVNGIAPGFVPTHFADFITNDMKLVISLPDPLYFIGLSLACSGLCTSVCITFELGTGRLKKILHSSVSLDNFSFVSEVGQSLQYTHKCILAYLLVVGIWCGLFLTCIQLH